MVTNFDPELAMMRFGSGLPGRPDIPTSLDQWMASVDGKTETEFPMPMWSELQPILMEINLQKRAYKKAKDDKARKEAEDKLRVVNRLRTNSRSQILQNLIARGTYDRTGFSTRLSLFWMDHFAASIRFALEEVLPGDYLDAALRPHILGRFDEMLLGVLQHPLMLNYLDQTKSVGPNSPVGLKKKARGLNENLAREVLELHTVGVSANYTQTDVRSLAKLLTGISFRVDRGVHWKRGVAEPGPQTVLGKTYDAPDFTRVEQVARDLAAHPATANHLAFKMARHFIKDDPDPEMVAAMAKAYGTGDLNAMTRAMLEHPLAWDPTPQNIKWGMDFVISVLRGLGVKREEFFAISHKQVRGWIEKPLGEMGQRPFRPGTPAGYDELDDAILTPQVLAKRLDWCLTAPDKFLRGLPDPRAILESSIGHRISDDLRFAVTAAADRREALALIFVSPAFQRR